MISIPLFLSEKHPCSYLEGEEAQPAFVHPLFKMTPSIYSQLIEKGYRRSGDEVYSPHCQTCSACIPARLRVSEFIPNRSQIRCLRKNAEIQVTIKPAEFNEAHYEMYIRYQSERHTDGAMAHSSQQDYLRFLKSSWCDTSFVEFSIDGELAAIAVVDKLENALSAVYTFFEAKFSDKSLGVYAVLWQIEWAKLLKKEFLYLGFWIKECQKMSYKSNYQPLQIYQNKEWMVFDDS